jgi:hypothetical protein
MTQHEITVSVVAALNNAVLNGYSTVLSMMTDAELATDLATYDSVCEKVDIPRIIEAVRVWRKRHPHAR